MLAQKKRHENHDDAVERAVRNGKDPEQPGWIVTASVDPSHPVGLFQFSLDVDFYVEHCGTSHIQHG